MLRLSIGFALLTAALLPYQALVRGASAQEKETVCEAWGANKEIRMRVSGALASYYARQCDERSAQAAEAAPAQPDERVISRSAERTQIRGRDRLVNDPGQDVDGTTQSETTIAQSRRTLCAAWNDSGATSGFSGFGHSQNRGRSWTDGGAFPAGIFNDLIDTNFGDPSLAWSERDRAFYYAALSSAGIAPVDGIIRAGSLSLWRSTNECRSFQYVGPIHLGDPEGFDDKELIAIDNYQWSQYYGRVYVGWTNFSLFPGDVEQVTYSDDGGATWSQPATLPGSGPNAQGMWPAIAPNDHVFFAFLDREFVPGALQDQRIFKSEDGGDTWFEVTPIATDLLAPADPDSTEACTLAGEDGAFPLNGNIRNLPSPQIAIHRNPYAPAGYTIHAVYAYDSDGAGPDQSNVFHRFSADGGITWSDERQLNDDNTTTDQFFPALGVNEYGIVVASWYDRRLDPVNNLSFDRFAALSLNGGWHWEPNFRISDQSSPVAQTLPNFDPILRDCYHGDYDQLTVDPFGANIIWSDDRRVTATGPNPDIYFERRPLEFLTYSPRPVAAAGN